MSDALPTFGVVTRWTPNAFRGMDIDVEGGFVRWRDYWPVLAAFQSMEIENASLLARIAELEVEVETANRLPYDVAMSVVAARDALVADDPDEAYHQLYLLAEDMASDPLKPWVEIESVAKREVEP